VSVRITGDERDALFEQIYARLSGIDEVWMAAAAEDWSLADEVAREFCDYLRLIVDDLGWGEGSGEVLELRTAPDVLRRVFTRLQKKASGLRAREEEERTEAKLREERTEQVLEACRRVLEGLEEGDARE
jgi:hypothetical protein